MSAPESGVKPPLSAGPPGVASLHAEKGPLAGKTFVVAEARPFLIGRSKRAQIVVPDPLVSRRHCQIELRAGNFFVRDLDSINGTLVNGKRVSVSALADGDRLQVGKSVFLFRAQAKADPLIGRLVDGYRITHLVGRGGMGSVYRAEQISLGRQVALKVLSEELAEDPSFVELFLREAKAAASLNHPNIVKVFAVGSVEGRPYFTMEFVPGGTVEERIAACGPLPIEEALHIALQTAEGLVYAAKKKLVHRDIKPGNLLLHSDGSVKICDLGIAATVDRQPAEEVRGGGSPYYIAPEQALGRAVDPRADIYSLGVSLFTMLAGRPPFGGKSSREIALHHVKTPPPPLSSFRPDAPQAVCDLVAAMMAKRPENRPQSAEEVRDKIKALLAGPVEAAKPAARSRALGVLAAVVLFAALAGLIAASAYRAITEQRAYEAKVEAVVSRARKLFQAKSLIEAETLLAGFLKEHAGREQNAPVVRLLAEVREEIASVRKKRREEAARRALNAVKQTNDPATLKKFAETWAGTKAARKAEELRRVLIEKLRKQAEREKEAAKSYERLRKESAKYEKSGNYRLAYELWNTFSYSGTKAAAQAEEFKKSIVKRARTALREAKTRAMKLAGAGDGPGALAVLSTLSLPPPLLPELQAARKEALKEAAAAAARKKKQVLSEDLELLKKTQQEAISCVRAGAFRKAVAACRDLLTRLKTVEARDKAQEELELYEALSGIIRRSMVERRDQALVFPLFSPEQPVRITRIREAFLEYYENPTDQIARRCRWTKLPPERFVALLQHLSRSEFERKACTKLAEKLGVRAETHGRASVAPGGSTP